MNVEGRPGKARMNVERGTWKDDPVGKDERGTWNVEG